MVSREHSSVFKVTSANHQQSSVAGTEEVRREVERDVTGQTGRVRVKKEGPGGPLDRAWNVPFQPSGVTEII